MLVVDRIGKNFSGTGVDPNITGTFSTPYASGGVRVQRTCFLRLTEESHGNALGVGLANAVTRRIYDQIDTDAMYTSLHGRPQKQLRRKNDERTCRNGYAGHPGGRV